MAAGSRFFAYGGGAVGRRAFVSGAAALATAPARAAGAPVLRLGVLPFGTVQWVAETIRLNGLDAANGFSLRTAKLANTEAAKVALMGHAVDVAVSDWPFVAAQRSHGGTLTFTPFSSSLGGIMVPAASPVRGLADLKGLRLGVAGGAADKSWLIVRAAAAKQGVDLTQSAQLSFGAPPLLSATLAQGGLDALLTFWNFCARLQAGGLREAIPVADCARILGLQAPPVLVGYVFDAAWASANPALIEGFVKASVMAETLLATRPAQWQAIRPFMDAPGDTLFQNLKSRFLQGVSRPDAATLRAQATQLLAVLAQPGSAQHGSAQHGSAQHGGDQHGGDPGASLPDGVFWQGA